MEVDGTRRPARGAAGRRTRGCRTRGCRRARRDARREMRDGDGAEHVEAEHVEGRDHVEQRDRRDRRRRAVGPVGTDERRAVGQAEHVDQQARGRPAGDGSGETGRAETSGETSGEMKTCEMNDGEMNDGLVRDVGRVAPRKVDGSIMRRGEQRSSNAYDGIGRPSRERSDERSSGSPTRWRREIDELMNESSHDREHAATSALPWSFLMRRASSHHDVWRASCTSRSRIGEPGRC